MLCYHALRRSLLSNTIFLWECVKLTLPSRLKFEIILLSFLTFLFMSLCPSLEDAVVMSLFNFLSYKTRVFCHLGTGHISCKTFSSYPELSCAGPCVKIFLVKNLVMFHFEPGTRYPFFDEKLIYKKLVLRY